MPLILAAIAGQEHQLRAVEMMDLPAASHKDVERRHLPSLGIFPVIVAIVRVVSGRKQPQMIPRSAAGEVSNAPNGRFCCNHEVGALPKMRLRAVQTIDERSAHGARQLHRRTEHKAVNHQRIQPVPKKLGKLDGTHGLCVREVRCPFFKNVS
jgi:hypothetical protein